MAKGRKTGGKPKGYKAPHTLDKQFQREKLRALVCAALPAMTAAQIANAQGIKYLVTRNKQSGKFIRVTEAMAKAVQGSDEEIIEVWEKDPSVQAYTDLMNRALDKPKDQPQDLAISGTLNIVDILKQRHGRRRAQSSE